MFELRRLEKIKFLHYCYSSIYGGDLSRVSNALRVETRNNKAEKRRKRERERERENERKRKEKRGER